MKIQELFKYVLCRKKPVSPSFFNTKLKRCLNTLDVTLMGTGHIIGAGIWILSGKLTKITGPGIVLSYVLCGLMAFLAALPYAEFGGRIPKAGSVYSYGYITLGELWAFLIGWDLVIENMLGAAALAVGWSKNFDVILRDIPEVDPAQNYVPSITGEKILSDKVDYVAAAAIVTICIFIMLGVKCSTLFNSIISALSIVLIGVTVSFGLTFSESRLWTDSFYVEQQCGTNFTNGQHLEKIEPFSKNDNPFLPYGFGKVLEQCVDVFFAFIGFETVTSAGEEVKDCRKTMPRGIMLAMTVVMLCYMLMIVTLTLMAPYCKMPEYAPWAILFSHRGYVWAKYLAWTGAMCALTSVLYGYLFCLPRNVYALASDGLLCKFLAYVHPRTKVPAAAVVILGVLSVIPALFLTLDFLTEMVSIGTLTAYNIMACSIIILRYRPDSRGISSVDMLCGDEERVGRLKESFSFLTPIFGRLEPGTAAVWLTATMIPFMIGFAVVIRFKIFAPWSYALLAICMSMVLLCVFFLFAHQQSKAEELYFKVPFIPFLPTLSLFLNIILMLQFPRNTWIRFGLWFVIGLVLYFVYGVYHSKENKYGAQLSIVPTTVSSGDNKSCLPLSLSLSRDNSRNHRAISLQMQQRRY